MNNASAGPWWFTAVVAGIAAVTALITGLVTAKITNEYANRRANADRYNIRSQFEKQLDTQREQFERQMSAQREIERRKLVHDSREKLYLEMSEAYLAVFSTTWGLAQADEFVERQELLDNLSSGLERVHRVATACMVVGSVEVRENSQFISSYLPTFWEEINELVAGGHADRETVDSVIDPVRSWFKQLEAAMRSDLGVTD